MPTVVRAVFASALLAAWLPSAAPAACAGDCNGDNVVPINELIVGVNIALGNAPISNCPAIDTNRSGSVAINELIAAVNALLVGCPPGPTPTSTPEPTPTGGIDPIFPANYRDTFFEVRDCRLAIEHGGVMIRVYANDIGAQPYIDLANPLPVGSVVIKEEFNGIDCSNDEELIRWSAMRKEAAGFDPDDGDWHWQRVNAPQRQVECDDKRCPTFPCLGCHRQAACLARDYMCTEGTAPRIAPRPVLTALPAALLSVSGRAPTDVVAVGADPGDGKGPLILRYNGTDWRRLESGATGDLWWISVTPIDGDFYMAGEGGLILQFDPDGGGFTRHTTPGPQQLFGIWGTTATNLWAVGEDSANPDTGGLVWHFDGDHWTAQDLSSVRPGGIPGLLKVWGRSATEIYAVGRRAFAMRFNGESWSEIPVTGIPATRPLFTVHGNDTVTGASGGLFAEGALLELGETGFTPRTPAGAPQQNGIFIPPDGRAVAVGTGLSVSTRDDTGWSLRVTGDDPLRDYHAVWIDPQNGVWAVGGDLADLIDGVLAYGGTQSVPNTIVP